MFGLIETCPHLGVGIANAEERELINHEPGYDLGLASALHVNLDGQQILLPDQKCEQPNLLPIKLIVHVTQPLVFVVVVALRLVAKQDDGTATGLGARRLDLVDEPDSLAGIGTFVRIWIADRLQQICKKGAFRVKRLVLSLRLVSSDSWIGLCEKQYCRRYKKYVHSLKLSLRQIPIAGMSAMVDYAGKTMSVTDALTGEVRQVQIFVGVLASSSYTFCEATESQRLHDWIRTPTKPRQRNALQTPAGKAGIELSRLSLVQTVDDYDALPPWNMLATQR